MNTADEGLEVEVMCECLNYVHMIFPAAGPRVGAVYPVVCRQCKGTVCLGITADSRWLISYYRREDDQDDPTPIPPAPDFPRIKVGRRKRC